MNIIKKIKRSIVLASVVAIAVGTFANLIAPTSVANAAASVVNCTPAELAKMKTNWYMNTAGFYFGADGFATTPQLIDNTAATVDTSVTPAKKIVGGEGTTVVSDTNGNLLFWTDGNTVWNREQKIMPNGTNLGGNYSATQSTVALSSVTNPNIFFVISVTSGFDSQAQADASPYATDRRLRWSEIDMSLNGGLGDVVSTAHSLPLGTDPYVTEQALTAVPDDTASGFWVVTTTSDNRVLAWHFDANGPTSQTPVVSNFTATPANPNPSQTAPWFWSNYASFALSPDMKTLAYVDSGRTGEATGITGYNSRVILFLFDAATGSFTQNTFWDVSTIGQTGYGAEWSPNGQYLYVSNLAEPDPTQSILRYDVSSGNSATIKASEYDVIQTSDVPADIITPGYYVGALRLASNGQIYVAGGVNTQANMMSNGYMHVITNPDASDPGFQWGALKFPGTASAGISVPQFASGCALPLVIKKNITFNSNGGSDVPGQTVVVGQTATEPSPPTKDGYTFDYWYTCSDSAQAKYDFATPITGDLQLCAKWLPGVPNSGFAILGYGSIVGLIILVAAFMRISRVKKISRK